MRSANRIVVGLTLAAAVSSVHAEHWVTAAKNDKETVYIDGASIKRDEQGNVLVWTKHILSKKPMVVENRSVAMSMVRDAFDCTHNRFWSLSTTAYDEKGEVLEVIDSSSVFEEIPPGTVIASIEQISCDVAKRLGI